MKTLDAQSAEETLPSLIKYSEFFTQAGLMLEMSVLKLLMVANLHYQLS